MDGDGSEPQINLHIDAEHLAGVYANYATVGFSNYEFTITFARLEHEAEGDIPGYVVSRVNMSPAFTQQLIALLADTWSKWESREAIRNLPEVPPPAA